MSDLYPCPICGETKGYRLYNGETYRYWDVNCTSCGELIAECHSDRRTDLRSKLPETWQDADDAWNENAEYAYKLKCKVEELEKIIAMAQDGGKHEH